MIYSSQIKELEQATADMLHIVQNASPSQRNFQPNPTSWSLLGVVEHLVIAEKGTLGFFQKYNPNESKHQANLKSKFKNLLGKITFSVPVKIKAPSPVLYPKGGLDLEQLTKDWTTYRASILKIVNSFPAEKANYTVFKHPLIGPMTMKQTLNFMTTHIRHHIKQMKRIQASEGYLAV